ncbi:MAG TPA: histone deacetylase [Syntrophales bacterium]|nr:histone deacetylase [Syntrophales bacterium]HOD99097.1 histone deacetylase [Syntrophales bacterium]HOH73761.1 histone deacetylase [Syntrophales bacterium]HPX80959.1 histone deacetylase [Syntrophales bacterium]
MANRTGVVVDERYLRHGEGYYHPESPRRLESLYAMLQHPGMEGKYTIIAPRYATHEEIGLVHSPSYIGLVASTAGKSYYSLDADTQTSPESYDTAKLAVGGVLNAVEAVMNGQVDNAFAFVRPPGHHAGKERGAGFCLFNNVAVGARYALGKYGLKRILIADWDLHHGDGTQEIFYRDKKVLYFSTHQYPAYPGSGTFTETGQGDGSGYTVNVPLKARTDDALHVKAFRGILQPVALKFQPELVLLSAGFDSYFQDPLGDMRVTPKGYVYMMRILLDITAACCGGRLVAVLEGGYNVEGLTESVKLVLREMRGDTRASEDDLYRMEYEAEQGKDQILRRVTEQINPVWQVF